MKLKTKSYIYLKHWKNYSRLDWDALARQVDPKIKRLRKREGFYYTGVYMFTDGSCAEWHITGDEGTGRGIAQCWAYGTSFVDDLFDNTNLTKTRKAQLKIKFQECELDEFPWLKKVKRSGKVFGGTP